MKRLVGSLKKLTDVLSRGLLLMYALTFSILPVLLLQRLVPEYLESETVTVVLKTIIDVCGVLIGFTGILASVQMSHAGNRGVIHGLLGRFAPRETHKDTLNAAGLTLTLFLFSILVGIVGLVFTSPRTFLSTWPVKICSFLMASGIVCLFYILHVQSTAGQ